ncbi:MAG: capsular polysaccharide biosynthesis protein [Roseivivax sp.]|nr:capsular polysaccharide biosynthesis protein [Roseivivax sp.]
MSRTGITDAGEGTSRRLFVYNGGFLWQPRLRHILAQAGFSLCTGRPKEDDCVGVWGRSPTAARGERIAARSGATLIRIEDAFLRSLHPGRSGEPPLGLLVDRRGVHFDGRKPSDLEHILATHPLDDAALLARARDGMARMKAAHLGKYSAVDPALPVPQPGYVLVVDQTAGDASLTACGADRARFVEMLVRAQEENPGTRVVIKTHPETTRGLRPGYFNEADLSDRVSFVDTAVSPWTLMEGAVAVYTVSSQLGFEAILAGHRPQVYGQPFYAGWGLTEDDMPVARRERRLTRAQLFAAAMILAPVWYDPYRATRAEFEDVLAALEAQVRAWREDRAGWVAGGMRRWKRRTVQAMFGAQRRVVFEDNPGRAAARAEAAGRRHMIWASSAEDSVRAVRVEDGFVRSRGLGARLVPPLSLACDGHGIYYDPRQGSDLERLIAASPGLSEAAQDRARRLIRQLLRDRVSKYNLGGEPVPLPAGHRILVPGQVADDASIRLGCGSVATNRALLQAVREANPAAVIVYKPHPDVQAGLRAGAVPDASRWADVVLAEAEIAQLLEVVDEVWTMTSLSGFEGLLRGCRVVTMGVPFYAGWGLTRDHGAVPQRRLSVHGVTLEGLVHAALIAYPRYRDPVTGLPCPVEVAVDRLARGPLPGRGAWLGGLARMQAAMARRGSFWGS